MPTDDFSEEIVKNYDNVICIKIFSVYSVFSIYKLGATEIITFEFFIILYFRWS